MGELADLLSAEELSWRNNLAPMEESDWELVDEVDDTHEWGEIIAEQIGGNMTAAYTFSRIDGLDTKFPKAFFNEEKYSFSISKELAYNLKQGVVYNIEWEEKEVTAKGKTWKQKVLIQAVPQEYATRAPVPQSKTEPSSPKTAVSEPNKAIVEPVKGNGKYSQSEIEAFARKDEDMKTMCAMNSATQFMLAYKDVGIANETFKGLNEAEIKSFLVASFATQFEANKKRLGIREDNK